MACESYIRHFVDSVYVFTIKVVRKIFPNLNIVAHLVVPAGWGSCLLRLAIFSFVVTVVLVSISPDSN